MAESTRLLEGVEAPAVGTWAIDPVHSSVEFVARYVMVSKVRGRFADFEGTIQVGETPEDSRVELTIQAASIDTRDAKRDGHLKSPDFLDVERFPTLTFRSTKVERTGEQDLRIEGDLTIRDVTRPVVLESAYLGAGPDPFGNSRVAFTATTEIDREEFGVKWNQALDTGGVMVGNRVRIELEVAGVFQGGEGE